MIKINNCPSTLEKGFDTYSPKAMKQLFAGQKVSPILDFGIEEFKTTGEIARAMKRISVSGAQEKFPAVVDNGKIRIAGDDERSTYILKPAPWDETLPTRKQIPMNEHLTMQIASQVYGIPTAYNGLCFTKDGQTVYITKRFDVTTEGKKHPMEDFASVVGRNEASVGIYFKYEGCYADIAEAIKRYIPAWMVATEQFFELVLFNYIYANGDDHLKNFSLIQVDGDYRLAPAYDLINTSIHLDGDDFGLNGGLSPDLEKSDVYVHSGHPCRVDFERFGIRIGLQPRRVARILDKYMEMPELTKLLVAQSYLNEKMKRSYVRVVNERFKRFIRISE